jgi:Na+-driven multidrug efflux pump
MTALSRQKGPAAPAPAYKVPPGVLDGPVAPTMLRLAVPTILVLVVQTLVGVVETYFVGFLGTEALAGVTLVFPVLMLMQMMAASAAASPRPSRGLWERNAARMPKR